jgi:hypothetical protein
MLATVNILRQRADNIGMAETEIHIEGENHIRVKLASLESVWDKAEEKVQPMSPDNWSDDLFLLVMLRATLNIGQLE